MDRARLHATRDHSKQTEAKAQQDLLTVGQGLSQPAIPNTYPLTPAMADFSVLHEPGYDTCRPVHDPTAFYLSAAITGGLLISYLPQHIRIIWNKSSEGIDPLFLLLGATSSASSFLNILALSWASVRCCRFMPGTSCLESMMGVIQIGAQWACFNLIFILFLAYFPVHEKYVSWVPGDPPINKPSKVWRHIARAFRPANYSGEEEVMTPTSEDSFDFGATTAYSTTTLRRSERAKTAPSPEWRTSIMSAVLTAFHLAICSFVTFLLLLSLPKASQPPHDPDEPLPGLGNDNRDARVVRYWATFLGVLSTILALFQYIPQITRTWRRKLVGSLSVPMMCIQTPGSFVFVYSLYVRPGVDWTSWGVYLLTGVLQGALLVMCIVWTFRQKRLGVDAYGNPLDGAAQPAERRRLLR